jgi:hypothetical protein
LPLNGPLSEQCLKVESVNLALPQKVHWLLLHVNPT